MKFKAVIFDMDGLMFDTESLFSVAQSAIAKKRGKEFTLEIKAKMMGQRPLHAVEIMLNELGIKEDAQKVFEEQAEMYVKLLRDRSEPMPGLFELLEFIEKANIRKCIATSSLREWADILLARFKISERFEFLVTGDQVARGKPDPEMYLKAVEKLGLLAPQCLVLEDSSNGIRAAKSAGCFAVAVPSEFTKDQDLSMADMMVKSLDDQELFKIFK
jgi:HAD superfamily hydrolase (TIGR01509 family)